MNSNDTPIVVGYDGSADADLALRWALDTAETERTRLVTVIAARSLEHLPASVRELEQQSVESATGAARDLLKAAVDVPSELVVERGNPLRVLLRASGAARLVVVGSRGYGPVESHLVGSVSHHLARHSRCSVAVVRAAHDVRARRILVGIDGSPASVRALKFAALRASTTQESVLAVHAYRYPALSGTPIGLLASDIDTERADAAERLAAEIVAGLSIDFPDLDLRSTAVVGRPGHVLSRLSEESSLVVVGARGRTPVAEMLLGSVSQQALDGARCPVVVVR